MRLLEVLLSCLVFCGLAGALNVKGFSKALSKIGGKFGNAKNYLEDIEHVGDLAGYNFAALGTYWRSNTLAGFSQMKRGEVEEAIGTFNLAISTLAVWDLGQGIAKPIADKLIGKIVLKYQDDFRETMAAFKEFRRVIETMVLDDATKVKSSDVLKGSLLEAKGKISAAFQLDVEKGLAGKFKNTQIYADLVTDLQGVKTWAKAAKWADVLAGPLFDAATVAVSAWQLAEAIKSKDPFAIASSSLSLASGLAGLTAFAVGALATAGSTIAAVAGPVGAVIGAILGIASIIVEIIASVNPYTQIDQDINTIKSLTEASKKTLDANMENLQKLVPGREDFTFSWVYEVNQGLMLAFVRGRADEYYDPVKFRLDVSPKEKHGYMVVGKQKVLDKGKYPNNIFWKPEGLVKIGYDFYGKKVTEKFQGVTVFVSADLLAGKPDVQLKGADIITFNEDYPDAPDNVVIGEMYEIAIQNQVAIKTGGGDDVIQINGVVGNPAGKHGHYLDVYTIPYGSYSEQLESIRKENNILSLEGMSQKQKKHGIIGFTFNFADSSLKYRTGSEESPKISRWALIRGIKMFVGSPFNDIVTMEMDQDYVVRQTKGQNTYIIKNTSWGPSKITIDDQAEQPGELIFVGGVRSWELIFDDNAKTLYIYGQRGSQRWHVRGQIFFNRRVEGEPVVRTEVDGLERYLSEFPSSFYVPGNHAQEKYIKSGVVYNYYFIGNCESNDCGIFKVVFHPPQFPNGNYVFHLRKKKNSNDLLFMAPDFVKKCIKEAKTLTALLRGKSPIWYFRLLAPDRVIHAACPALDIQVQIRNFEKLFEQKEDGESRLVVDLHRDQRFHIDIPTELQKLDNRQDYKFNKNVEGSLGISQVEMLRKPENENPSEPVAYTIDMKGGQPLSGDTLIYTEELRNWLKEGNKKITLTKEIKGAWKLDIRKKDGTATHTVTLKNIERIEYEPGDGSLRQPVMPDLATETRSSVDLEAETSGLLEIYERRHSSDCHD